MGHGHSRVLEPALSFPPPQQLLSHFKLCGEGEQPSLPFPLWVIPQPQLRQRPLSFLETGWAPSLFIFSLLEALLGAVSTGITPA